MLVKIQNLVQVLDWFAVTIDRTLFQSFGAHPIVIVSEIHVIIAEAAHFNRVSTIAATVVVGGRVKQ